jgi:hypothetical protein
MSSSASDDEDAPPQGGHGVLSAGQARAALIAETLALGGALWSAPKEFLNLREQTQVSILYLAVFAFSALITFALARVSHRTKVWGVTASGCAVSVLLLTLTAMVQAGNTPPVVAAPATSTATSSATPTAAPTQTSAPAEPPSPTPPQTSPRPAADVSATAPPRSADCQDRLQYRVIEAGYVRDADKQPLGWVEEGEMFILLDEPVHVDKWRYGTVGGDTGYVLMSKLDLVEDTVCV